MRNKLREITKERMMVYIRYAIREVIKNDKDILNVDVNRLHWFGYKYKRGDRKLHEITICHRLAFYLECVLLKDKIHDYSVDLEYNRYFRQQKRVWVDGKNIIVRPDIVIHKRMGDVKQDANLLVVEAKKYSFKKKDKRHVQAMMVDKRYLYKFGLAILFKDAGHVEGKFYYKDSNGGLQKVEL